MRAWTKRGEADWLPGPPDHDRQRRGAAPERRRREVFDAGSPPSGLTVVPGTPDGWRIELRVRRERSVAPRVAVGIGLVLATLVAFAVEPVVAVLPAFALLAFLGVVVFDETGPGFEEAGDLELSSRGVRCGEVAVPAAAVRDVFWVERHAGERTLCVRSPDHTETEVVRVPVAPAFRYGLTDVQRAWIAEAVRAVGRTNMGRRGTEEDVPAELKRRLAEREP